ncbi:MAG TPA: winged helix DNA-binding domain-containing protein [Albitalea sp.]|uniref:winged helix DNA-binding domain-containing protein n=1 Tax=Piscinibacter sp. TaxID=1903157 RepID=UPI002ED21286
MQAAEVARRRLASQGLVDPSFASAAEVVEWLGAVQSQDYAGSQWALGQRMRSATAAGIEQALNDADIVRTHVLRPTWHFVSARDIRWMLALSAPRVHAANASMYRKLGLDAALFRRSNAAIVDALAGGHELTRNELAAVLRRARIDPGDGVRMSGLMMAAELDGWICNGPRRGRQFTYALLDERVPPTDPLSREQALRELAWRYFRSRGPATVHDFAWWSGLTVADAKKGVEMLAGELAQATVDGRVHWFAESAAPAGSRASVAHLLPNYDEFVVGFRDRGAVLQAIRSLASPSPFDPLFAHVIEVGGQLVGGWRRELARDAVRVELTLVAAVSASQRRAVSAAARRYASFLGLALEETSR